MLRWTAAALAALLTLVVACGSGERGATRSERQAPAATTSGAPRAAAPSPEPGPAMPPIGEVRVTRDGDRFTVLANDAERLAVLRELERIGGFVLALRAGPSLSSRITLQVEGQPLEVALALALVGVDHTIEYEPAEPGPGRVLARLAVGDRGSAPPRPLPTPPPFSDGGADVALEARLRSEEQAAKAKLESTSPEVRAEAVADLDVETASGFRSVAERLAKDPDPGVRAAAAETLAEAGAGSVPALLQALDDGDPRVVVAAIDALEQVGDASLVPQLRPLLQHRDPETRARAAEAIQFLE